MAKKVDLTKSIDTMIDELFAEKVEKSDRPDNLKVAEMSSTEADQVADKAPKSQDDKDRGAGRPAQISDVPKIDEDGKRAGKYDNDIVEKTKEEGEENEEGKKQADAKRSDQTMDGKMKDSGEGMKVAMGVQKSISDEEYAEFQAFKKARAQKSQEETLRKAKEEQRDLVKSAIREAVSPFIKENEELRKSLAQTNELVKAMAERPQRRKSIDGIGALEKSENAAPKGPENFSKSEMLDVAEELVMKSQAAKDMTFRDEHLIELENTGFIYDAKARAAFEQALKNRK